MRVATSWLAKDILTTNIWLANKKIKIFGESQVARLRWLRILETPTLAITVPKGYQPSY